MWAPSLTFRPQASRLAIPRKSSLRFSQLLAGATIPTVSPSCRRGGLRGAAWPPEPGDLRGRCGAAVDDELAQDPADDRGELERVGRAEGDEDVRLVRQAIDDEVAVGRQGVQAGLRRDLRPEMARQVALQEIGQPGE